MNPKDCAWQHLYWMNMRTLLQERETIHCSTPNLVGKIILMPQAMKIPAAKAAVVQTKGAKVHFATLMDTSHLKNAELEAKHQEYKGRVVLRGDNLRRFWVSCSIHWTRIFSITNDSRQDHGYHLQTARLRKTSSRRSICLYPGWKWRVHPKNWKFPNLNVQTFGSVQCGRPSRSSWAKSVWSSFGRTFVGKAIWENPLEIRLGKRFPIENAYHRVQKER